MCSEPVGASVKDIDGECPHCCEPTVDGESTEICDWSPVLCVECGWAPCDDSC